MRNAENSVVPSNAWVPLVERFDKVWYGIFMVLVVEMAQITPPVAFNLSIIQGITSYPMGYLCRVTLPFLAMMMAFTLMLAIFPEIVLWFPELVLGR